jgi:hypothetical protein
MMFNPFVLKKNAGIALASVLTPLLFSIGMVYYNLWVGIGMMMAGLLANFFIVGKLIDNPFRQMLEGKGIMAIKWDSTGVMQPFVVGLQNPFIKGMLDKNTPVNDVFDRDLTGNLAEPVSVKANTWEQDENGIMINISKEEYNKARFAMFHYPVLLWNDQLKSFITKDQLSEKEKDTFAEHGILYAVRLIQDIGADIKNFSRAVVDTTQKKGGKIGSIMIWIIAIIIIGVILMLAGPSLMNMLGGVQDAVGGVMPTEAVTPK